MKNKTLWIVVAVVAVVLIYVWTGYNGFVAKNAAVDKQWAQVETQYQRRLDLIPNLVESVKGVMKQEQSIITAVTEARMKYGGAVTVDEKAAAASQIESSLGRLLVIMENYPELKSAENVQTLQAQLEGTENRVSVERQRYNENLQILNVAVQSFPSNVIAGLFGFDARPYFQAASGAENAPKVGF